MKLMALRSLKIGQCSAIEEAQLHRGQAPSTRGKDHVRRDRLERERVAVQFEAQPGLECCSLVAEVTHNARVTRVRNQSGSMHLLKGGNFGFVEDVHSIQ